MTRRAFLMAAGLAAGVAAANLVGLWLPKGKAQGVNGNICLRAALIACRPLLLYPYAWMECVIAVYTACVLAIIIGTQGRR